MSEPIRLGFAVPRQYRLVSGVIEAMQLTAETAKEAALWCSGMEIEEIDPIDSTKKFAGINFATREGVKRASQGDYIIKAHAGDFDVMKPGEFESKYEPI